MRLVRALVPVLCAGALVASTPGEAYAQPSGCSVLAGTRNVNNITTARGTVVTHISRPRLRCNDGRYIEADSMVYYGASEFTNMLGRVLFRTDGRELRAATARYFEALGRLEADSAVELRDLDQGTVITGEQLLYLRAQPQRPQETLHVWGGRPRALLYPRQDTLREDTTPLDSITPYEVVADDIYLVGDQIFQAEGGVGVVRDSLLAFSDSLDYDQVGGALDLTGTPARVVQGELDLRGRSLRILLPGDVVEEVVARDEALLTTDSLDVDAPFIRIFMDDGALERLVAAVPRTPGVSPGAGAPVPAPTPQPGAPGEALDSAPPPVRARAVSTSLTMEADSLDVIAPGERIERMTAVGKARAVSTVRDTLNTAETPESILHDWIEGDTVKAAFARVSSDTDPSGSEVVLESLEARLNARSLYRLDPDSTQRADTTAFRGRLPVNYTEATGILLLFDNGTITRMEWEGLQRGIQLQPALRPDDAPRPSGGGDDDR